MRKIPYTLAALYCFFLLSGRVYGIGEKIITFGSAASWELMEKRERVAEALNIRPFPVLALADEINPQKNLTNCYFYDESFLDLFLGFDEGRPSGFADAQGRYDVFVSPELAVAAAPKSRLGAGAALFDGTCSEPITIKPRRNALFAPGNHIRDFSVEFWLFPQDLENGEQVLSWISSKPDRKGVFINQSIRCVSIKDRLQWTFSNFFFSPGEESQKTLSFSGPMLISRTWSHHLIRFDADLGLLEYLVDGKIETIIYATPSGKEGGEVYTPVTGNNGHFVLGSQFSGMMDNFRVYRCFVEKASVAKYPERGGRAESRTVDLGYADSRILKVEAFGGRTINFSGKVKNEYAGNGALRFRDHAEMSFFVRVSNSPYHWNEVPWIPVHPGVELGGHVKGRYIQVAADFYPGEDGETSPYLSELKVVYKAAEPPSPPTLVTAIAKDGAVELFWRASSSKNTGGYLIYFGTAKGEYFGNQAGLRSPFNAGNRTSCLVEGLDNGTLYYFTVAAYSKADEESYAQMALPEPGEFSMEVAARPLSISGISSISGMSR